MLVIECPHPVDVRIKVGVDAALPCHACGIFHFFSLKGQPVGNLGVRYILRLVEVVAARVPVSFVCGFHICDTVYKFRYFRK